MAKIWSKNTQVALVAWVSAWAKNERSRSHSLGFLGSLMGCCLVSSPLAAQVTSDDTVGTKTKTENNVTEITGGTTSGSNLFHSFQQFSLDNGSTAYFNNDVDVSNIIGRVTGSGSSNIDGLIRGNGEANLILINPNGITLGSNARLDIGGSFLGSTAESVLFEDGTVFNADPNSPPLLTISTPVGLQLGQDSAGITVSGTADPTTGLAVSTGHTFALVGNGITFDGGVVTAESGRIELGSVEAGQVSIKEIAAGWQLGYEAVTQFGELQLLNRSALLNPNSSANTTGGIQVQGNNILLERSQISAQTLADTPGGNIVVNASESLVLSGEAAVGQNSSQISNNVPQGATGKGGSIDITTGKLEINPRSFIDNSIFGSGSAGNIKITATEINILGAGFLEAQQKYRVDAFSGNLRPGSRITGIFAGTATTGTAGNITIETNALNLTDGAIIFTPVFTAGHGGNINVTAKDINLDASAIQNGGGVDSETTASLGNINLKSDRLNVSNGGLVINATFGDVSGGDINVTADIIDLRNTPPESIIGTGLFTNTSQGTGQGGNLQIQANTINLTQAIIASNSGAIFPDGKIVPIGGKGGNIEIAARAKIEASGVVYNFSNNPELTVGAGIGTTTYSSADGGDLSIDTGKLILRDGASFGSLNVNSGNGGQLTINATDSVELIGSTDQTNLIRGGLFASSGVIESPQPSFSGSSGDIKVTTPNLIVRDGALIDVRSNASGDAGSINLVADSVFLANKGALSATTKDGAGGNIAINAKTVQVNRGLINASVLGKGTGGNIEIVAQDSVRVTGSSFSELKTNIFNLDKITPEFLASLSIEQFTEGIFAVSIAEGNAGIINIQSANLTMKEGGLIATATTGSGAAGKIDLDIAESLLIDSSFVSNNSLFLGAGGDISINTDSLEILRGGQITASTLGKGNGGNVTIDAQKSVTIAGNQGPTFVSNISVGARPLPTITGNGGNLTINTPQLLIDDLGTIAIDSTGSGDAGSLEVNANSIMLDRQATISADTQSGGGNIKLSGENIVWRGASSTTAAARKTGNGGNIIIQADNVLALEDSLVTADAFQGMGGNIQIDTQGLFICESCRVSASSALGIDGVVDINTLEPTTLNSLDIPQQPTQPQEEVAVACPSAPGNTASRLTITGRGGLPNRPQETLSGRSLIEFDSPTAAIKTPVKQATLPAPAQGWYRQDDGQVVLTAQVTSGKAHNSVANAVDCHQ